MLDIRKLLAEEFNLQQWQIDNTLNLHNEGATLHFIARYRKERTGNLDEVILRQIFDRFEYLIELEERKKTVLNTISEQGKLTDELKNQIENCLSKTELEDLYLPFKPKKRTRATIAKEKGLEPLAQIIKQHNTPDADDLDLLKVAEQFVNLEKGVASAKEAISGAADIIAEEISEIAEYRSWIRNFIMDNGYFTSQIKN
ncbi:MAG TPA: Tex-like N-terminal domain-containing protein, partial [Candidatus Kapabacteria bacterium]|nr:Tex-like N-terminal domain-containing protein [Candidatus Kapabacteria bacterium]